MGQALRNIQQVYDDKLEVTRGDVETFYNLKVDIHYLIISQSISSIFQENHIISLQFTM